MFTTDVFRNKVVVITGGGTGLGRSFALEFSRLGASVAVLGRRTEPLDAVVGEIRRSGGLASSFPTDIRLLEQVQRTREAIVARYGRVDILINNAAGNFVNYFTNISKNGWDAVTNIVLAGTFHCTSTFGQQMIAQKQGGKVVNLVASYAWVGAPGNAHSGAAKAAVLNLTKTLAVEWAPYHIQVNALAPGYVDTEGSRRQLWPTAEIQEKMLQRIPSRRFAREEEIAWAITYLCSPYADYITGSTLVIDGGEWLNKGAFLPDEPSPSSP